MAAASNWRASGEALAERARSPSSMLLQDLRAPASADSQEHSMPSDQQTEQPPAESEQQDSTHSQPTRGTGLLSTLGKSMCALSNAGNDAAQDFDESVKHPTQQSGDSTAGSSGGESEQQQQPTQQSQLSQELPPQQQLPKTSTGYGKHRRIAPLQRAPVASTATQPETTAELREWQAGQAVAAAEAEAQKAAQHPGIRQRGLEAADTAEKWGERLVGGTAAIFGRVLRLGRGQRMPKPLQRAVSGGESEPVKQKGAWQSGQRVLEQIGHAAQEEGHAVQHALGMDHEVVPEGNEGGMGDFAGLPCYEGRKGEQESEQEQAVGQGGQEQGEEQKQVQQEVKQGEQAQNEDQPFLSGRTTLSMSSSSSDQGNEQQDQEEGQGSEGMHLLGMEEKVSAVEESIRHPFGAVAKALGVAEVPPEAGAVMGEAKEGAQQQEEQQQEQQNKQPEIVQADRGSEGSVEQPEQNEPEVDQADKGSEVSIEQQEQQHEQSEQPELEQADNSSGASSDSSVQQQQSPLHTTTSQGDHEITRGLFAAMQAEVGGTYE